MKLKSNFQIFLFLSILFTGMGVFAQDISSELSDFKEVKVFNGVVVEMVPSETNRIEISGHSKEEIKFQVVENRLEIRLNLENIWAEDNTRVKVYASSLEVIDANEGAVVDIPEQLEGNFLNFRAQEGAAIYAKVEAERVYVKAITAGIVQLRGKSANLEVDVNTGGRYFGEQLTSEEAEVKTGTGGQAEVYASEYIKATASLGGSISIFGNPDKLDRKTTLGGKILKKN